MTLVDTQKKNNPKTAKAKGRRLQQLVVKKLLLLLPGVQPDDIQSRSMGANGEDIMLSPYARSKFPYSVECKNQEKINLWKAWEQTQGNAEDYQPLLIVGKNNTKPLAVVDLDYFLNLQRLDNANR
jgi:hypothetical protein|tara:strand:+ start:791 stop:1168 length:378 start_codon:yes stop_codon:yes gene_type:complete